MPQTTYLQFLTRLANLNTSGVTRFYRMSETPPTALNAADLPAQWIDFTGGDEPPLTFQAGGGWPEFRGRLVVAVMAYGGSTTPESYQACVNMMDNLSDALRNSDLARGGTSWSIDVAPVVVGDIHYWAVIVEVTAPG